jgi:hypothetical protein
MRSTACWAPCRSGCACRLGSAPLSSGEPHLHQRLGRPIRSSTIAYLLTNGAAGGAPDHGRTRPPVALAQAHPIPIGPMIAFATAPSSGARLLRRRRATSVWRSAGAWSLALAVWVDLFVRGLLVYPERSSDVHVVSCGWVTPIRVAQARRLLGADSGCVNPAGTRAAFSARQLSLRTGAAGRGD